MGSLWLLAFLIPPAAAVVWGERQLARAGYRRTVRPPRDPVAHEILPGAFACRGGARLGRWRAPFPFATLRVDGELAQIDLSPLGSWMGTPRSVRVPRREIVAVRRIGRSGVRFASADGAWDGVIFWAGGYEAPRLCGELRSLGWAVEPG